MHGILGALVLGSRSEFNRGEWKQFQDGSLVLRPVGSVAYKLSLVAAGLADCHLNARSQARVGCCRRNRAGAGCRRHSSQPGRLPRDLQLRQALAAGPDRSGTQSLFGDLTRS